MALPLEPADPRRLGRYELLGRLGEGGQGVVYLGQAPDGPQVAVKVLRSSADPRMLDRLARELDAVHQVQPFVTAQVLEAGTDGALRYVVTEFIDGPSLQDRVARGGPLRDGELHRLAVGTATALTAIHGSGVIHRDFKPANVLLGPDGPRVVDFGIARLIDTGTVTSHLIGTPSYLAPEQLAGAAATPAVDLFTWAVTMVYAATGRPAFGSDSVSAVMNRIAHAAPDLTGIPPSLHEVIADCLDKNPAHRPTARDLLVRLVDPSASRRPTPGAYGTPSVPPATLSMPTRRAPVPSYGRSVVKIVGGVAVLLLLAAVASWLSERGKHSPPDTTSTHSSTRTDPPTTASSVAGTIPAAYGGTWRGTIEEHVLTTKNTQVTVKLPAGGRSGEADYDQQSCRGALALTSANSSQLVFELTFTSGSCVPGTVTLSKKDDKLDYQWHDAAGLASSQGLLDHSG